MNISNKIKMDLTRRGNTPIVDVMQGDANTRIIEFSLYAGGAAWNVPDGVEVLVGYGGESGRGLYSTLMDDVTPAYTVSGNVVTVTLIPQVTAVAGRTTITVMFMDDAGNQIATFNVSIRVSPNPGIGAGQPEDYFSIRQWIGAGPLFVTISTTGTQAANGNQMCNTDHTYEDVLTAKASGRNVIGIINNKVLVPLARIDTSAAIFQGPTGTALGQDWQVQLGATWGNEAQLAVVKFAFKSDLNSYAKVTDLADYAKVTDLNAYAKSADLKNPLYVTLTPATGETCTSSHTHAEIKAAYDSGREVIGVLNSVVMPLINIASSVAVFQGPTASGSDRRVIVYADSSKAPAVSSVEYAFKNDLEDVAMAADLAAYALAPVAADEGFFDINADGVISLKPEYRGCSTEEYAADYPFSVSDKGVGVDGSGLADFPETLVIPQTVDGEEVTGFQAGMFCGNQRVKEIVIPVTVKTLPDGFAKEAIHLEKLTNTEQLETIGTGALQQTRIGRLDCPNLTSLGSEAFRYAYCLKRADLGKITSIPDYAFKLCANLSDVKADQAVSIGLHSFYGTRRLKSLSFLANVKSLGDGAFWSSRCDLEGLPDDCTFGELSCYKQFNDTEYWDGVAFTPCKNPLGSLFSQNDPRWADKEIKYTDSNGTEWIYDNGAGGVCTYASNGCALLTLVSIYSALMGVQFDSPEEIFPIFEEAGVLGINFRGRDGWCDIAEGLGLETEYITEMTAEDLQKVYGALADGALLYKSTVGSVSSGTADGGHAMLGYGINSDGEMLTSDTAMHGYKVGIYENHKTAWHIYKHGSKLCDCVIVRKKQEE